MWYLCMVAERIQAETTEDMLCYICKRCWKCSYIYTPEQLFWKLRILVLKHLSLTPEEKQALEVVFLTFLTHSCAAFGASWNQ